MTEGLPKQVNYLIDEAVSCGKGANVVISLIHHFFENYGLGEKTMFLNADNCSGQNKNSAMLWYLCWRVFVGLHTSITISFLLTGHTKFAPDWCFGLFKQTFRRTRVSCLDDIVGCVNSSTVTGVNMAQLVGSEDGQVFVPMYDWVSFLSTFFVKLQGIKKFHHFSVDAAGPGTVICKEFSDSPSVVYNLGRLVPTGMPKVITPGGLDQKRRKYLYDQIREFCTEATMDLVCPQPEENAAAQINPDFRVDEPAPAPVEPQGARTEIKKRGHGRVQGQKRSCGHNSRSGTENLSSSFSDAAQEPIIKERRKSGRGRGHCQGRGRYNQDIN